MRFFEVVNVSETAPAAGKSTSGLLKSLERGFKKLKKAVIDNDQLKEFWRAGRAGLDALAGASGIPLTTLRQQYRNVGIDPDKFDIAFTDNVEAIGLDGMTPSQAMAAAEDAEERTKMNSDMLPMIGLLGAAYLMFGSRGRGRRGRARSYRRPFRMRRRLRRRYR